MPSAHLLAVPIALVGAAFAFPARPAAQPGAFDTVALRIALVAELTPAQIDAALRTVRGILQRSGVAMTARVCASRARPGWPEPTICNHPLGTNEVIVRILNATPAAPPGSLGFSYVAPGAATNLMATAYADRVDTLAAQAGIPPPLLLGRVVAHEVGHLLLGTTGHSLRGLMRARWSDVDLRSTVAADWLFTRAEGGRLRAQLSAASARAAAGQPGRHAN